ncbi:hypothetical protein TNCV_943811 [Trichonephila clavipes]|nr:hypothetical protein TNCV_943811 [Trichonephila clavipes]
MMVMAYCAHPSIRDYWALRCWSLPRTNVRRVLVPLKNHHVDRLIHVKSVLAESPPVGSVGRESLDSRVPAQMPSSFLDRGSKFASFRDKSPMQNVLDIDEHSSMASPKRSKRILLA